MDKKWRLLILLVGFIICWACEKENPVPIQPHSKKANERTYGLKIENHKQNALDHLGVQHYQVLDHLADENCIDTTEKTRYQEVEDYLLDTLDGQHSLTFTNAEKEYEDYLGDTAGDRQGLLDLDQAYFIDYLTTNAGLDTSVEEYYQDMKHLYDPFKDYDSLVSDLKNLETTIDNDSTLTQDETDILLGSMAVARNDLAYWQEVRNTSNHAWHTAFTEDLTSQEAEELMLQLSLSAGINFGLIYDRARGNNYTGKDRLSAALIQASFSVGPTIVDSGNF